MCLELLAIVFWADTGLAVNPAAQNIHMHRHAPSAQVIDAQDATYNIPSQVVKDQHFPYWFTIFIQDRDRGDGEAAARSLILVAIATFLSVVI